MEQIETKQVEVKVEITLSKTVKINIYEGDEIDKNKLMTAFDSQRYSPEQLGSFLDEYLHRRSIGNIQNKRRDLSGWQVINKDINLV